LTKFSHEIFKMKDAALSARILSERTRLRFSCTLSYATFVEKPIQGCLAT
jgi:hypothetical protein